MEFLKYHALGNDYLVSTSEHPDFSENELTSELVRKICHRNFGLGSDGILVGVKDVIRSFLSDDVGSNKK